MTENRAYGFNPDLFSGDPNANPHLLSYPPNYSDHHPPHHHPHYPPQHYPHNPPPHNTGNQKGYYWVACRADHPHPSHAVVGGVDQDGTTIYVGRAFHEGDYIPAKVIPEKRVAYVAYGGEEHAKHEFEVLCEQRFEWVQSSNGHVPHNAVVGGRTSDGETLYIGRCYHDGSHTVGKIHPSHGCLYIPFGGEELKHDNYEILIML